MALSLRRNAAWALLGQVVFAACHWGGFIILGRLGGPEVLGRYVLALAVVTPIMMFGRLQMRELQVADAAQRHPFEDYLAVRLAGTGCAGGSSWRSPFSVTPGQRPWRSFWWHWRGGSRI